MLVHLTLGWAWNWALESEHVPLSGDVPCARCAHRRRKPETLHLGLLRLGIVLTPFREGASTGVGSISEPRFALLCKLFCSVPEGTRVGIKH